MNNRSLDASGIHMNLNGNITFDGFPQNISDSIEEIKLAIAQINSKNPRCIEYPDKIDKGHSTYKEDTIRKLKEYIADLQEKIRNDPNLWMPLGKQPCNASIYFRKAAKQGKRYCLSSERCLPIQTG